MFSTPGTIDYIKGYERCSDVREAGCTLGQRDQVDIRAGWGRPYFVYNTQNLHRRSPVFIILTDCGTHNVLNSSPFIQLANRGHLQVGNCKAGMS